MCGTHLDMADLYVDSLLGTCVEARGVVDSALRQISLCNNRCTR